MEDPLISPQQNLSNSEGGGAILPKSHAAAFINYFRTILNFRSQPELIRSTINTNSTTTIEIESEPVTLEQDHCLLKTARYTGCRQESLNMLFKDHKLSVFGHTMIELPDILLHNIHRLDGENKTRLTLSQRKAFEDLKNFPERYELGSRQPDNLDLLEAWIQLFDNLYFFGNLHEYIRVSIRPPSEDFISHGCSDGKEMILSQATLINNTWETHANITLRLHDSRFGSPKDQLQVYLETLLHEMLHACLGIYSCCCEPCGDALKKVGGATGHGLGWLKVWKAIDCHIDVLSIGRCKFEITPDFERMLLEGLVWEIIAKLEKGINNKTVKNTFRYALPGAKNYLYRQAYYWGPEMEKLVGITKAEIEELDVNPDALGATLAIRFPNDRGIYKILRVLRSRKECMRVMREAIRKCGIHLLARDKIGSAQ